MLYILHPALPFLDRAALLELGRPDFTDQHYWNEALLGNKIALRHEIRQQLLLVPPAIARFLQFFSTENTVEAVIAEFSCEAGCAKADIEPVVTKFLNEMLHRGLIAPAVAFRRWQKKWGQLSTLAEQPSLFDEGEMFGAWVLEKMLSNKQGLSVYLAVCPSTSEKRVIKTQFVHPDAPKKARECAKKEFLLEFDLLCEMEQNPGVCRVFETGEAKGGFFAWLEFIEGKTPRSFLKENAPNLATGFDIIGQMLQLVGSVHRQGILHGDIHLSNFLIQDSGLVRLIDFDLANHARLHRGEIQRRGGVQDYLPPEKISANMFDFVEYPADFCSEAWQLGVCAYIVLHEKYPFVGFTWKELVQNILYSDPKLDTTLPAPVISFLEKALAKAPHARFPDVLRA